MTASERVTWETCPHCGWPAAVGWIDELAVEFDCPNGCQVTESEIASAFPSTRRPPT